MQQPTHQALPTQLPLHRDQTEARFAFLDLGCMVDLPVRYVEISRPEATATMTMRELERWIILEIAGKYHHRLHSSLNRPPLAVWRDAAGVVPLRLPVDRLKFWVAFLPE